MRLKPLVRELVRRGVASRTMVSSLYDGTQSEILDWIAQETVLRDTESALEVLAMGLSEDPRERHCFDVFFGRSTRRRAGERVTFLAGGRGGKTIIRACAPLWNSMEIIVNAYDDGLSTGRLRAHFGILGPSDIRKNHVALLRDDIPSERALATVLDWRVSSREEFGRILRTLASSPDEGAFDVELGKEFRTLTPEVKYWLGHYLSRFLEGCEEDTRNPLDFSDLSLGNCVYVGAYLLLSRDFPFAVRAVEKQILGLENASVHLCSDQMCWLCAVDGSGRLIPTEADLVETKHRSGISAIYLLTDLPDRILPRALRSWDVVHAGLSRCLDEVAIRPALAPDALASLQEAELLVYCPGTFHSSLAPTLLTDGIGESISGGNGVKVFMPNLDNDNESVGFDASDYLSRAHELLCRDPHPRMRSPRFFDYVLCDSARASEALHRLARKLDAEVIARPLRGPDGRSHDGPRSARYLAQLSALQRVDYRLKEGALVSGDPPRLTPALLEPEEELGTCA